MLPSWFRRPRPALEALEDRRVPSVVTSTADSGPGTLRPAILAANTPRAPHAPTFSRGGGVAPPPPASALPALTDAVTIDGPGPGGTPLVMLEGATSGQAAYDGLTVTAANCVIKGLVINRFANG